MTVPDIALFCLKSLKGYRSRTVLLLLAMSISVASVLLLTALGEGARRYVNSEFASLGTSLIIVLPGKSETSGSGFGAMVGLTPRDLTLEDAAALERHPAVSAIAPINVGSIEASWKSLKREVVVLGSTHALIGIRHWQLSTGRFLPEMDWNRATPVCVIGGKIRDELFGANAAVGQWIRLGQNRYRVIGVMASEGRSIGVDVQDVVIIPVASAQSLFNTSSLFRILIQARSRESTQPAIDFIVDTIRQRHHGIEDVTVITQDAVLQTFDNILSALTYGVGGIAAISLGVAGILIMNVMLISVSQRTAEIGLLKALGASRRSILKLILTEAVLLSLIGAVFGFIVGLSGCWLIRNALPELPAFPPLWAMLAAFVMIITTGLVFSLLPARKAARLDPVRALQGH